LAQLLTSLKHPTPVQRTQATEASLKAAKAWFTLGDYRQSLGIYDSLADRSSDPQTRVEAMGGAILCQAALGQPGDLHRRLALLQKEIPNLNEQQRPAWERWSAEAAGALKAALVKP